LFLSLRLTKDLSLFQRLPLPFLPLAYECLSLLAGVAPPLLFRTERQSPLRALGFFAAFARVSHVTCVSVPLFSCPSFPCSHLPTNRFLLRVPFPGYLFAISRGLTPVSLSPTIMKIPPLLLRVLNPPSPSPSPRFPHIPPQLIAFMNNFPSHQFSFCRPPIGCSSCDFLLFFFCHSCCCQAAH